MTTVISVEHLSKVYRLGQLGGRTLASDLSRWWARLRGRPDPFRKIGEPQREHRFGESINALDDVSFEVHQGEILGIIGRNGAGKSTLLKVLSQITAPTRGRVRIKGRVASLLEVGTGFHPELTGRENIFLNGAILGMTKAQTASRLDAIVEFAEVSKFLDTPVKRYSSGMYVRLAFAVAAHLEPDVLLVDEVLAVGDAAFQSKCLGKMSQEASSGRTVLFVSHNMTSIQALCPRSLVLEDGIVRFSGATQEALDLYLSRALPASSDCDLSRYRQPDCRELIRSLRILDSLGNPKQRFEIGSTIVLEVTLSSDREPVHHSIGIGIASDLGLRLFTVSTRASDFRLDALGGQATVCALLPQVRLAPGNYYAKIAIGDGYSDTDTLEQVPVFEILPSDYWGSGRLPGRKQGVMIQDVEWTIGGSRA